MLSLGELMRQSSHSPTRYSVQSTLSAPLRRREPSPSRWGSSLTVAIVLLMTLSAIAWSSQAEIDRVTRATGQLIASSRVHVIQVVDGGVVARLLVNEGDRVEPGQVVAELDSSRALAALQEADVRMAALNAAIARLTAEADMKPELRFPAALTGHPSLIAVQRGLFDQRRAALQTELDALERTAALARQELQIVDRLYRTGDVGEAEFVRLARLSHEAAVQPELRRRRFFQEVSMELSRAEEELAQLGHVREQRKQVLESLVLRAPARGIVKKLRVTTRGAVLRAGEEILQIVPADDRLIVEAKIRPADIGDLRPGLPVSIKFDAWDYTVHGSVPGRLTYISADTVRDESRPGEVEFYRVHIETDMTHGAIAVTATGRQIEVMPGMTAVVDIRTGTRTALAYFLAPFRRVLDEALTEP